jgi:hypothetical protein
MKRKTEECRPLFLKSNHRKAGRPVSGEKTADRGFVRSLDHGQPAQANTSEE